MKFAFVSTEGLSLSWWMRLLQEGHDVRAYIRERDASPVGRGLVEKADSFPALLQWGGRDATYVFDLSGFGTQADQLRASGHKVLGGSATGDKLEERKFGHRIARLLGIKTPKTVETKDLDEAIQFMKKQPDDAQWYFKPADKDAPSAATYGGRDRDDLIYMLEHFKEMFGKMEGILQQKIEGVCIDTAWWWNGSKILGFLGMVEYKKQANGDLGASTGCATNLLWRYSDKLPLIARKLRVGDVEGLFRRLNLAPGEYDINSVVSKSDKAPYYLEWGPRFGWDADATYLQGLTQPLGEALEELAKGSLSQLPFRTGEYWAGVHVGVPPYPYTDYKDRKHSAYKIPVREIPDLVGDRFAPYGLMLSDNERRSEPRLMVSSAYGNVGVALGKGNTVDEAVKEMYASTEDIKIPDVFWRTDMGKHEKEDLRLLKGWGYEVK